VELYCNLRNGERIKENEYKDMRSKNSEVENTEARNAKVNWTLVDVNLCGARVCRHPVAVCINHCMWGHPAGRPLAKE
jgi:hypothetical protein